MRTLNRSQYLTYVKCLMFGCGFGNKIHRNTPEIPLFFYIENQCFYTSGNTRRDCTCHLRLSFPQKRTWSQRMRLILRSLLKLECFEYNNNNGDFVNPHYLEQRSRKVLYHWSLVCTKVSSRRVWKLPWKEMAKVNQSFI